MGSDKKWKTKSEDNVNSWANVNLIMLSFTLAHQLLTLICASYVGVFTFGSGTCLIFARCLFFSWDSAG